MFKYRLNKVGAQFNAPLLLYGFFSGLILFCPQLVFAESNKICPPCRVDTLLTYPWCPGDTIQIAGNNYLAPGLYGLTFQSILGCDSLVSIHIQPISDTPYFSQNPLPQYIGVGDTGIFSSASTSAVACRWQMRVGTGVWLDVQPDSFHSNPFLSNPFLSNTFLSNLRVVPQGGDSNRFYRYTCRGCLAEASSNPAELRVYPQQLPVTVQLPSMTSCVGVNTVVAVRVSAWQNVGRIALDLIVPATALQLVQWSARMSGLTLSVQGDTVKIRKATSLPALSAAGDTMLVLVVRPLISGTLPLTWLIPDSGTVGLQYIDPNTSWVHRLVHINGQIVVPSQPAQVLQEPVSASVGSGDSVAFVAVCNNSTSFRWQIRTGTTWRSLVDAGAYNGTQSSVLRLNHAPDSLNNARFRLIAFGACGRNDTTSSVDLRVESRAPVIRFILPQVLACTTGQYVFSQHVDSFTQVAAFSLRFTFNPDSIQFVSNDYLHPSLVAGGQLIQQPGAIALNWYGSQPLQLGSVELLRLRFQVTGSSLLEWDTSAQGTNAWSLFQQRLRMSTENGAVVQGPLPAQLTPIPCLFVGDAPVVLSAWPPGGIFSGAGVQGQLLQVDSSPGLRTVHYQATHQGCPYAGEMTYEVFPALALPWLNNLDVCRGTPVTLTARRASGTIWSTGDSSASIILNPISDTLVWVRYLSPSGCLRADSVRIRLRTGPHASVDDTLYYYNNNNGPVQLRASGGISYRWRPAAGLSDSLSPTPLAAPDTTTAYTVVVTDSFGCNRSLGVVVARPRINPSPNHVICRGDSIRLSAPVLYTHLPNNGFQPSFAAPSISYLWQPTAGLDDPSSPSPMASPGNTIRYQVRAVVAQNCALTAHRSVIVRPTPQVELGADSIHTSIGHPVQLMTHVWDTASPVVYHWSPSNGLSDSSQPRPWANPSSTTTYILNVRSTVGCHSSDTVVVVVAPGGQGAVLQGQLIYDNASQTPLRTGVVRLETVAAPLPISNGADHNLFKGWRNQEKKPK